MRLRVIACEVLQREISHAAAHSPHMVDVEFLEKGLHDQGGAAMREELQRRVDAVDPTKYDAIAMGYALCGNGLHGLAATRLKIAAPRAHDCIALLMGSRERYERYFADNPGTYFRSTGWIERGKGLTPLVQVRTGVGTALEELIAKYGVDNGTYLYSELNKYQAAYRHMVFIENGFDPEHRCADEARAEADTCGWTFSTLEGDLRLIRMLVNGAWSDDEFVVVQPGERIVARYDERIVHVEQVKD